MAVYFETLTQEGDPVVQISDTYPPLVLVKSVRLYNSDFSASTEYSAFATVSMSAHPLVSPMVFFKSPNANDRCAPVIRGTDNVVELHRWYNLPIQTYVDVFIFDRARPASTSNSGLEIFSATGDRIFDSDWYFLNIQQIVNMLESDAPFQFGTNIAFTAALSVSGDVAVSKSVYRTAIVGNGGTGGAWAQECVWITGSSININYVPVYSDSIADNDFPVGYLNNQATQIYVADVSGFPLPYSAPL